MLRKRIIPPCEKIWVEGRDPVPVFFLSDRVYPVYPFVMKEFSGGGRNEREKCFNYKLSSARILIENWSGRLKAQFRCLQRTMDVKLDILPQVIYSCFVLHNHSENKKENLPDQNLMSAPSFEERVQPSTSSLSYGERVNENKAISIRNTLTLYFEYCIVLVLQNLPFAGAPFKQYT